MKLTHKINIKRDLHYFIFSNLNELRHWGITSNDVRILAELYNQDFDLANNQKILNYEDRMTILFSQNIKNKIMEKLNISYNTFNNSLSKLRKKSFVSQNNTIDEKLLFNLNKPEFTFTINCISDGQDT
jgi:hypothetical protein